MIIQTLEGTLKEQMKVTGRAFPNQGKSRCIHNGDVCISRSQGQGMQAQRDAESGPGVSEMT